MPAKSKSAAKAMVSRKSDLFTWIGTQVRLLSNGSIYEIDALGIAEELEEMGRSELRSLISAITMVSQHLLKWDYQPDKRSRSWMASIREHRRRIEDDLADSPGLKSKLAEAMIQGYRDGRSRAIEDTGMPEVTFPRKCPYTFDEMMTREIAIEP